MRFECRYNCTLAEAFPSIEWLDENMLRRESVFNDNMVLEVNILSAINTTEVSVGYRDGMRLSCITLTRSQTRLLTSVAELDLLLYTRLWRGGGSTSIRSQIEKGLVL